MNPNNDDLLRTSPEDPVGGDPTYFTPTDLVFEEGEGGTKTELDLVRSRRFRTSTENS